MAAVGAIAFLVWLENRLLFKQKPGTFKTTLLDILFTLTQRKCGRESN